MQLWISQRSQTTTLHDSTTTPPSTQGQTAPCSSSTWILPHKKTPNPKQNHNIPSGIPCPEFQTTNSALTSLHKKFIYILFYFQVWLRYLEINQEIQCVEVRQLLAGLWDDQCHTPAVPGLSHPVLQAIHTTRTKNSNTSLRFQGTRKAPKVQC